MRAGLCPARIFCPIYAFFYNIILSVSKFLKFTCDFSKAEG